MKIFNQTTIRLSAFDALKALLGKPIRLSTEIELSGELVQVVGTTQTICVDPLIPAKYEQVQSMAPIAS